MLGSIPSDATIEKAARLAHTGRVHGAGCAAVFHVGGDHAIYRVVVFDDETAICGCPATGMCSHAAAAMLIHAEAVDRVA